MKKQLKRYMALVLTFALVFAIPFAFTQEASAAAKKKAKKQTIFFTTNYTSTTKNADGSTYKYSYTTKYNKKHLVTKETWKSGKEGGKTVYKYNKKGYVTSVKNYNNKGKLIEKATIKSNKQGLPVSVKFYSVNGKKNTLTYSKTLYYNGKKVAKYDWYDYVEKMGGTEVISNNAPAGDSSTDTNAKFDKKGRVIEDTWTWTDEPEEIEEGVTATKTNVEVTKYFYKKSDTMAYKETSTTTSTTTYSDGRAAKVEKSNSTRTAKYKKYKMSAKAINKLNAIQTVNMYASYTW